ncbi:MAG: DUF2007 domain-containing protein [Mariniphaga sp.]
MKLITVKQSRYAADLAILKSRLESEGIPCWLKNELTSQVINYVPSIYAELQVSEDDVERVKVILAQIGEISSEEKS